MPRKRFSPAGRLVGAACALWLLAAPAARGQALFQEKTSADATSITGTNWTTPTNIQTDNGAYASYNNTAQDWIVVKTFGFSIPAASVIDGIQVVVQGYSPNTQTARRAFDAALTKDGSTVAGSAVLALQMPNPSDADVAVSSAGAFWSTTWTAAELNNGSFGVMFRDNNTTAHVLYFDSMTVTAHYRTIDDVTVTPTALAPGTIAQGSDYAVEKLSLATNANTATWTAVTVTKTGTLADGSVTAVKIYLDANGNGTYESGSDTLVSPAAAFSGGSAAITLTAPQTITTTAKVYFVVYNLATLAATGDTIGATVASGALTVTYPDTVLTTNLPASSGSSTVTDGADTITVTPTDQAGASVAQGADYSAERLSLATDQETATWTAVTVTKTGNLADAKITTVKIYLDANANGTYESGTDTLISPAVTTFSGGTAAITLSAAQTITTTAKAYFVVYTLDATATVGGTIGAQIASSSALTVTGPDLVASTNLPAGSTNSSVTDVADTITVTPTDVAPANIVQGGDFALEKLSLATGGDEAVWTAITVTKTGNLIDGEVTTVKIYLDDGSGTYDGADTLVSPAVTTFSGGAAAITLSAAQTINTTPKVYFIVYTLSVAATVGNTIGAQASVGALTATAPDTVAATNLPANSSNATVIALGDTITATPADLAPGTIAQGTADTAMQKLSLVTNANSATWTDITVTKSGTLADAQVTTVKVYLDANANGTFEAGSDTLISPAVNTFSSGLSAITLSAAQTINTTPKVYFIVYTLAAYPSPGATIGASIASNSHLVVTSPDIVATTNFPLNSTNAAVTDVADTVTVTPTSMAPGSVAQGSDYAAEKLSMATGADEAVWTAVTVTKTGSLADGDITTVKIYLDANANGTYESGSDTLISPAVTTFSGGSAAITLSAAQTITTTAKVYFIVYGLQTTAAIGNTIGAQVAASGSLTLTAPDAVSGTFPMSSANSTVTDAQDTITVTPTNMAGASIAQNSDYAVEKLSLAANQETATWTAITVAKTGTLADNKITTVKIYLDANANGTYESGTDTLISPAVTTFSGGSAAITLSAAQTITTTAKVYFVVYVLDVEATIGATVGAQVASGALTATAPDAVATTNLPANSTNSSVTDAADTIAITATDVVGAQFGQGETKALLRLSMATGADSAVWTAVTIAKLGNLADGSVTTIRVYLDDGDGVFDSALDTLVSPSANTFTAGSVAITLSAAQTITAAPKVYFVVYQLSVSATVGNTIGARVNASGSLTVTAPDGVSGTFPMDSTAATVAAPDTVTAVPTSAAPAGIGQGADYAAEKLSLTTNGNTASWTAVKVTKSGTTNRTNVTAVKVYLDDGSGDYGNEDTLLAADVFGGGGNVTLTLSPAQTITTTAKVYFIVYTLSAATPVNDTVGASVAAATDMTIASPDTMATTNFPANSSNSTVEAPDYGVTVSPSLITVGSVALNQNYLVTTGVTVTNVGNMGTTYEMKVTTVTAGSPWAVSTAQGPDQYTMQGLFNSAQPVVGDYTASDRLLDSATLCLGGKFEGDRSCQQVRPGNVRTLWLNVGMPTASSTEAVQDFKIDVTATIP